SPAHWLTLRHRNPSTQPLAQTDTSVQKCDRQGAREYGQPVADPDHDLAAPVRIHYRRAVPMNRYYKFGIGACLLVAAIGYLMYAGLQQSSTYYFTIDEFLPRKHELGGQGVRVAGRVAPGSLVKQTSAKGTAMTFSIGDFKGADAMAETLP